MREIAKGVQNSIGESASIVNEENVDGQHQAGHGGERIIGPLGAVPGCLEASS